MSKTPAKGRAKPAPKAPSRRKAANPAELAVQTFERVIDPLKSVLKGAGPNRAVRDPFEPTPPAVPVVAGKPGLKVSPLAVDFPRIPAIAGVELGVGRAGLYKHVRDDLLVMHFPEGAACAGVFTRHHVGSAPVDWCKRQFEQNGGEGVKALVINAGCANAFTGKPGADAARRTAGAAAKRLGCRQRDVMLASTGVIGVVLDDHKIAELIQEFFDLRPGAIIRDLDLRRPIYRQLAAYGHMGREDLGVKWENTDRVDALKAALA